MKNLAIPAAMIVLVAAAFADDLRRAPMLPEMKDLVEGVPADFPRFYLGGHEKEAQLLSNYLWYHFSKRPGNGRTLFNKEYLTMSDLWLAGAVDEKRKKTIQEVHREDILGIRMDDEGYVHTHQHFSHAHEHGWPFPIWPQAAMSPDKLPGVAAGWHFQEKVPGWVGDYINGWKDTPYRGVRATQGWELQNVRSLGISENRWRLEATGESPAIVTPAGMEIEAFQAPFLQLRWTRTGEPKRHALPYVEWMREEDGGFGEDRRVCFYTPGEDLEGVTGVKHSMIEMYRHPKWTGKIKRIRIALAPGESDVKFAIDSFFTVYDTRHTINNPIFIFACWNYFRWTGDLGFLRANIGRMRQALRYQQTEMGGQKYNRIRNPWWGHDGLSGFVVNADGSKTLRPGHGIGSNYWDILPFGGDDAYATNQYYASLLVMAEVEEAIRANPGWNMPLGGCAFDPAELRKHAEAVKAETNRLFWNKKNGRFVACVDAEGRTHDYGFTFLNLDAIWYGVASDEHAAAIMDWLDGRRIVKGDTSTGADIYHWRFAPRATTRRNVEWYCQGWWSPDSIPFGSQVQDGGAVLGFTFYDLWARLRLLGPDNAWNRLAEILKWEDEVRAAGGYREYYKDGKQGTTLQGCGTAGGLGIDCEFYESSLLPSIIIYGFLGLDPGGTALSIRPVLPEACPEMGVSNLLYRGVRLDIKASDKSIAVQVNDRPAEPIRVRLHGKWRKVGTRLRASEFELREPGVYEFAR